MILHAVLHIYLCTYNIRSNLQNTLSLHCISMVLLVHWKILILFLILECRLSIDSLMQHHCMTMMYSYCNNEQFYWTHQISSDINPLTYLNRTHPYFVAIHCFWLILYALLRSKGIFWWSALYTSLTVRQINIMHSL